MEQPNQSRSPPDSGSDSIDLTCLLELNAGTAVVEQQGMGRVVVATRTMDGFGEKVIREKPGLVWTGTDWPQLLLKFCGCSSTLRSSILDMFLPPLDSDTMLPLREQAEVLSSCRIVTDIDLIHKLIAIVKTNGHQYYGKPDVIYTEKQAFPECRKEQLLMRCSSMLQRWHIPAVLTRLIHRRPKMAALSINSFDPCRMESSLHSHTWKSFLLLQPIVVVISFWNQSPSSANANAVWVQIFADFFVV